ncbi:MAG TPA: hypothetical protein VFQ39_11135, partial [Longimicrobium sp.]|nr:hypothetical protein [Longimicrobium sp.]
IAFRAAVAFARALDEEEDRRLARIREERRRRAASEAAARVSNLPAAYGPAEAGWYTGAFVPWLATLGAPEQRAAVRTLLPDAVAQNGAWRSSLDFTLGRLRAKSATAELSARLRTALDLYSGAWIGLAVGGLVFLVLLIQLF